MEALAFGMYVHVNPVPFVTGAPDLVKLLTEDLPGVAGGKLAVESDPVKAVAAMLAWISGKRAALGISSRQHLRLGRRGRGGRKGLPALVPLSQASSAWRSAPKLSKSPSKVAAGAHESPALAAR